MGAEVYDRVGDNPEDELASLTEVPHWSHRHTFSRPVHEISYCRDLRVWFHLAVEIAQEARAEG
ncbi:MAG: hypothetical protein JO115_06240 [Pseudonocardiales bacterium]|nr:hypothetical protein [Pseudonocardiales bacterium]